MVICCKRVLAAWPVHTFKVVSGEVIGRGFGFKVFVWGLRMGVGRSSGDPSGKQGLRGAYRGPSEMDCVERILNNIQL